jgi:hypothetical protein
MGDAAKELKKLLQEGDQDGPLVKALGTAEDIYGTMSGAYTVYSTGKELFDELSGGQEDPLADIKRMLDSIITKLDLALAGLEEIKSMIVDTSGLITRQFIGNEVADAITARDKAKVYLEFPDTSDFEEEFEAARASSEFRLGHVYGNNYYWMRLCVQDAVYSDVWSSPQYPEGGHCPEGAPDGDPYVWDYRVALPAYLVILASHTLLLLASEPEYRNPKMGEMAKYITHLGEVYKKIVNSFVSIQAPNRDELKCVIFAMDPGNFYWYRKEKITGETFPTYDFIDPKDGRRVRIQRFGSGSIDWIIGNRIPGGHWIQANYVFGEVERYSGYDCTAAYPQDELKAGAPLVGFTPPTIDYELTDWDSLWWEWHVKNTLTVKQPAQFQTFYDRFCVRHTLRKLRKRNQLYLELGLTELYQTIRHYYSTLKVAIPWELIDLHAKFASWSLREVYQEIRRCITGYPPPEAPISLRVMAGILEPFQAVVSPVISLRGLCLLDEEFTPL